MIANANRSKRSKPFKPDQFMPKWDREARPERRPEMTGEEMLRAARRITKGMGG